MKHELDHAVRISDIATRSAGLGKGGSKRWLPRAMLRVAFGHASASCVKSKAYRKAPGIFSLNSIAYWMKGSHGHIARVFWPDSVLDLICNFMIHDHNFN